MIPIILLGTALLLGLIALVLYVLWNPQILGILARKSEEIQKAIEAGQRELADVDDKIVDTDSKPRERLEKVEPEHFIEMSLSGGLEEFQVLGTLTLHELRQYGSSWEKSGTRYPALCLEGNVLLMRIASQWYFFQEHQDLTADGVERFREPGQRFGATNQTGVVEFDFNGQTWRCLDIGRYQVDVRGRTHHLDEDLVMFLLALATSEEDILLVENAKTGQDYVWFGKEVDPNELITRII